MSLLFLFNSQLNLSFIYQLLYAVFAYCIVFIYFFISFNFTSFLNKLHVLMSLFCSLVHYLSYYFRSVSCNVFFLLFPFSLYFCLLFVLSFLFSLKTDSCSVVFPLIK